MVEPTQLKNMSQNGNLPQIGVNIKNIWNHHLVIWLILVWLSSWTLRKRCFLFYSIERSPVMSSCRKKQWRACSNAGRYMPMRANPTESGDPYWLKVPEINTYRDILLWYTCTDTQKHHHRLYVRICIHPFKSLFVLFHPRFHGLVIVVELSFSW